VTFVGNRYWAFKYRKGKGLRHESMDFIVLNFVGNVIQGGNVDQSYYGMGYKDGLSYNLATIIGIAIATLFRLYAYRKFVFVEHRTEFSDQADDLAAASTATR
jgi:putative flippase GtrA